MLTKAQIAKLKAYVRETPKNEQGAMYLRAAAKTGICWFLPMLGWMEPHQGRMPTLIVSGTLIRISDNEGFGTGAWRIPITDNTVEKALALMAALGWDGRIWPEDKGWPTGTREEDGMLRLVAQVPLSNTMSFAPDPAKGNRVVRVVVSKSSGTIPMPFDVDPDEPSLVTDHLRERFAYLIGNAGIFMPSNWTGKDREIEGIDFT